MTGVRETASFSTSLQKEIPTLRRFAKTIVPNSADRDDLIQDTLLRAWQKQHLYQEQGSMASWLMRMMQNIHIDNGRQAITRNSAVADIRTKTPPVQDKVIEIREVERGLEKIPPDQKQVILMVGRDGMDYRQAAKVACVPIGTIMSRLARARTKLSHITEHSYG